MHALELAIEHCSGSQTELARRITETLNRTPPLKQGHVWGWLNRDKSVPLDVCPAIEKITNGLVTCEALRDDVAWTRDRRGRVTGYHVPIQAA